MVVKWNNNLNDKVRKAAMRGVVKATEEVRNEVIRLITQTAKTGRIYSRRGVEHQASAPGEAPAVDRGTHLRLITTQYEPSKLLGRVNSAAKYGPALEFGSSRILPRPHMNPALKNKKSAIAKLIADEISKALKTGGGKQV